MTPEQMERAIEFLLDHHAKFSTELEGLKEAVTRLVESTSRLEQSTAALERRAESDRAEIREAIENLILANEVTRKLSEDVTRLEVQTSQRVTRQSEEIAALIEQGKETDKRIAALSDQNKENSEQIAALSEQGKETDARLNALINIVERHITSSDAHKGKE
jgi:chromosome segregation ATPase